MILNLFQEGSLYAACSLRLTVHYTKSIEDNNSLFLTGAGLADYLGLRWHMSLEVGIELVNRDPGEYYATRRAQGAPSRIGLFSGKAH